jgi:hypothetical protein
MYAISCTQVDCFKSYRARWRSFSSPFAGPGRRRLLSKALLASLKDYDSRALTYPVLRIRISVVRTFPKASAEEEISYLFLKGIALSTG